MTVPQFQALALGILSALIFAVVGGSLIEWAKYLSGVWGGVKPSNGPKSPQATVGLIDLLVTVLTLVLFFFLATVSWRALGLPLDAKQVQTRSEIRVAPSGQVDPSSDETRATPTVAGESEIAGGEAESDAVQSQTKPPKAAGISQIRFLFSGYAMSAQLLCVLFMTLFITGRTGCIYKKLGWRTDQLLGDIRAGFQCFLMMTPLILVMNALLQNVTKTPYEHPVQEMIKLYPWLLGVAFWQAAIVAPISEEFAFRVLLIGWFESIHFGKDKIHALMFGAQEVYAPQAVEGINIPTPSMGPVDVSNPYRAPMLGTTANEKANELIADCRDETQTAYRAPWWPTLVSATLFGLAHFSYGVSWVPLIVFGIVLGRLYQQRQSVIPAIVVHMLFNGMNVIMLGLSLMMPKLGG